MIELKPCPFCGGDEIGLLTTAPLRNNGLWNVRCDGCCVETAYQDTKAEAIDAWNRRGARGPRLSPEVLSFAQLMQIKLDENSHKGGWDQCHIGYLMQRLEEEMGELKDALSDANEGEEVGLEAADVANFAMMIADRTGWLRFAECNNVDCNWRGPIPECYYLRAPGSPIGPLCPKCRETVEPVKSQGEPNGR